MRHTMTEPIETAPLSIPNVPKPLMERLSLYCGSTYPRRTYLDVISQALTEYLDREQQR